MRRLALIGWVLALGGRNALRDTFSGRQQIVGTAAGQTLTVERLAKLVGHASRIPVRPDVFTGLASVYLDYAVFAAALRSEEHTSELQSRRDLVCRLLLEKKKNTI